jgi:hypothetical protein
VAASGDCAQLVPDKPTTRTSAHATRAAATSPIDMNAPSPTFCHPGAELSFEPRVVKEQRRFQQARPVRFLWAVTREAQRAFKPTFRLTITLT